MKCHYIFAEGVGRVLIPGCMSVAVANDIDFCTCRPPQPTTPAQFERQRYNDVVLELKGIIEQLTADNAALFEENQELYRKLEKLTEKE